MPAHPENTQLRSYRAQDSFQAHGLNHRRFPVCIYWEFNVHKNNCQLLLNTHLYRLVSLKYSKHYKDYLCQVPFLLQVFSWMKSTTQYFKNQTLQKFTTQTLLSAASRHRLSFQSQIIPTISMNYHRLWTILHRFICTTDDKLTISTAMITTDQAHREHTSTHSVDIIDNIHIH